MQRQWDRIPYQDDEVFPENPDRYLVFTPIKKEKKNTKYQFSNENAMIKCSDNVINILKYIFYVPSYLCLETTYYC